MKSDKKIEKYIATLSCLWITSRLPKQILHNAFNEFVKEFVDCILPKFAGTKHIFRTYFWHSVDDHEAMVNIRNEALNCVTKPNTCMYICTLFNYNNALWKLE